MPTPLTQFENSLLLVACAAGAAACGGDEGTSRPAPLDPPTLQIAELLPAGGPAWPRSACEGDCSSYCVELGRDLAQTTLARVELRNWTLQPYLGCGEVPQCGFVLLTVTDPESESPLQISAAATLLPAELSRLSSPEGLLTFRAELRDGQGQPAESNTGAPLADEITVEVRARCDGDVVPGDASVLDASADAASEGGQPDGATPDAAAPDAADAAPAVDAPAEAGAPSDAMDARIVDAAGD